VIAPTRTLDASPGPRYGLQPRVCDARLAGNAGRILAFFKAMQRPFNLDYRLQIALQLSDGCLAVGVSGRHASIVVRLGIHHWQFIAGAIYAFLVGLPFSKQALAKGLKSRLFSLSLLGVALFIDVFFLFIVDGYSARRPLM